jgi:CBS domain containing-hemolysin-like protein/mannitol/fructose-specific phosphotransferase system IIA component
VLNLIDLFITFLLILLNGCFVIAELSLVRVRFTRLEELAAKGVPGARRAKKQVQHMDIYLSAIQLGVTMASLGVGWVGEPALAALLSPLFGFFGLHLAHCLAYSLSFALAFLLITFFHVILGELTPKYTALLMPERIALLAALPLELFYRAAWLPLYVITKSAHFFMRLLRIKPAENALLHSDDELRMILGQSQEHGRISLGRLLMFEHLFDFGKTRVKEIMTPRSALGVIDQARPWEETLKMLREKPYSRYPLLAKTGEISGYVHFKDIASCFLAQNAPVMPQLDAIKRPLVEISEEISAERALREFQEKRIQLALVKNVKGEPTGLLTMEDIVEELTGEIRDEFEQPPKLLLSDLLVSRACELDLKEAGRFEAIGEVLAKLHEASPTFDKDEALKAIIKRETNFSTALGHQTAFPHARLATLARPLLAIGKSRDGVLFPSPDGQPVKVLFLILTPFNEPTQQLNILSQLSGLISNVTLRKRLFSARNPADLLDVIRTFENKVMK